MPGQRPGGSTGRRHRSARRPWRRRGLEVQPRDRLVLRDRVAHLAGHEEPGRLGDSERRKRGSVTGDVIPDRAVSRESWVRNVRGRSREFGSGLPVRDSDVLLGLQVQPEPGAHAEEQPWPKRGVRRDGVLAVHQFADFAPCSRRMSGLLIARVTTRAFEIPVPPRRAAVGRPVRQADPGRAGHPEAVTRPGGCRAGARVDEPALRLMRAAPRRSRRSPSSASTPRRA